MGMAASQARYLALVARKSNCEYEGQQINQARLALSNQSANLFNQMLGLKVPVPPSTSDFTTKQYSFTDGVNTVTLDSWKQLATSDENYNYVVSYYYNADVYTGSQKKLNDPQVQFTYPAQEISSDYASQVAAIQNALTALNDAQKAYDDAKAEYQTLVSAASKLSTYKDSGTYTKVTGFTVDGGTGVYTVDYGDPAATIDFSPHIYSPAGTDTINQAITNLINNGAITEDEANNFYYNGSTLVFKSDLDALIGGPGGGTSTILPAYHAEIGGDTDEHSWSYIDDVTNKLNEAKLAQSTAKATLDLASAAYETLNVPNYVGNCKLTPLSTLNDDQQAELAQVLKDMAAQDVNTKISKYYNPETGEYTGGIFTFTMNGINYYTTYDDLADSAQSGHGNNHIDDQDRLAYYRADYVSTKITEDNVKALLETDGSGRFTTIRIEDDTVKYTLNVETITDENAYQDAMNQYYYENAQYDKMVQDINAKTSLIQQEDQQLELRLKQLDTEQNALKNEMEAVQKVVKDNVESSFKTFGG